MKTVVYSFVTPGYDEKVKDGRLYVDAHVDICERFRHARMVSRMVKALPHLFLDADACLWLDSNVTFVNGYSAEQLIEEYFSDTQHCGVFEHTMSTTIDQEIDTVNGLHLDVPELTSAHKGQEGRLAWTGILYRRFTPEVIEANNRWWAELSTKSSRDQLSFPYVFKGLTDYKVNPDLEEQGSGCWVKNSKWHVRRHLQACGKLR